MPATPFYPSQQAFTELPFSFTPSDRKFIKKMIDWFDELVCTGEQITGSSCMQIGRQKSREEREERCLR
jgi:hypothetical protein